MMNEKGRTALAQDRPASNKVVRDLQIENKIRALIKDELAETIPLAR